jgi:hypothetical protein
VDPKAIFMQGLSDGMEKTAKKWIQGAIKHPGALHRALGVPEGKDIPESKKREAAKRPGKVGRQARLALTLAKMRKGKGKRKKKE